MTCAVLMLFGMLGLASGCSAGDAQWEDVDSTAEAQTICNCPTDPCSTYTCDKLTCIAKPVRDGTACEDPNGAYKGRCLLGLCCPGCVVKNKLGTAACARGSGTDTTQCGISGELCENCANDLCQVGSCEKKACVRTPVDDGDSCTNGSGGCYKGSCCPGCIDKSGTCMPGGALDACGVSSGKLATCVDCTDGNACTAEACVSGSCQYPAADAGTSCDDGDKCNGDDACSGTSCKPGTPLNCDDGESCTKDSCGPGGCVHEALTGDKCSDGDPCTAGDKCGSDGKCGKGTPINCDDGEACTTDSCKDGTCVHDAKSNTTTCNDNNACTTGDKCTGGLCAGASASSSTCDDHNICTIDIQPDCTVDFCTHNTFAPSTTPCPSDKCHQASHCSGTDGSCVQGTPIDCGDNNDCTTDSCDPLVGCVNTNNAAADCSDGDPCTENDVCVKGTCGGKPKKCLALDACHEPGECGPTGVCTDIRSEDGKPCPGGACENGTCVLDPNAGTGGEGAGGASGGAGAAEGGQAPIVGVEGGTGPAVAGGDAGQSAEEQPGGDSGGSGGTKDATEEPDRPFVRNPSGCSCQMPGGGGGRPITFMALALLASVVVRRSRRERSAA
ncbi:MAG TPA: MYXO-CTERM sorting domain-containing protein [Polyangiaceae bacterium]|nr:MYXO-CTERM sorting domain-containing protein [Polyangiaceae bacterium]